MSPRTRDAKQHAKTRQRRRNVQERLAALHRRGVALPPPMVAAESWFGDSDLMQHVRDAHQGTVLVEGKASYCFTLADGQQIKGHDLIEGKGWRWHQHPWAAGVRYVRLRATSPTYGQVTVILVDALGQDRFYLVRLETERSAPQLIRRLRRRSWIEEIIFSLKHYWRFVDCEALEFKALS
jgi:hypothetical protein